MGSITYRASPPTAQTSFQGVDVVSYSMTQGALEQYLHTQNISEEAQSILNRLRLAGFYPSLILLNGGEVMKVECYSISSRSKPITNPYDYLPQGGLS